MFRVTQRFGRLGQAPPTRPRRPRSWTAAVEAVEDRTLMSALSAITWKSAGVEHSEVFAIGYNNSVYMSKDGGSLVSLGGIVTSISAGLDSAGNPEVYGIGSNSAVWVDDNGAGWVSRGGVATAISASVDNTVFAIGSNESVYINRAGTTWTDLGGDFSSISAGLDTTGNPEVYGINATSSGVYSSDSGGSLTFRGLAQVISASVNNTVYGIGSNNAVYFNNGGTTWNDLGGYALQISAGADTAGNPEVYAIGGNNAAYVSDNGSGFAEIGGYVTALSATANGGLYARGAVVDSIWLSKAGLPFTSVGSVPLTDPSAGTTYSPAPSSAPLYGSNGPSYLDVDQGAVGDCWLDASLAEVAARDPQDIKNMFTYEGTTVDNGSTVGLYQVRFYSPDGSAFYVKVDTDLPGGGATYDKVTNALGTQALWVALAEKGYAEANALGLVTTNAEGQGSYGALNNGWPYWALQAITGKSASGYSINPTNVATAWNAGQLVVLCTPTTPVSSAIVGSHCYAMVSYNASATEPFQLFNPWGTQSNGWAPGQTNKIYGLFTANAAFISQNFTEQSFGNGAINVNHVDESVDALTESGTLGDGYALSRTATVQGNGSSSTATGYTRPAQETAIGADPSDDTYAGEISGPAERVVVSLTGPTLTRFRSIIRK